MHLSLLNMNMDLSRTAYEGKWENYFIDAIQKIAIYTVIPFSFIVFFEAIVKNMIFINLYNLIVTVINGIFQKLEDLMAKRFR